MIITVTLNVSVDKAYKIKGCVESGKVRMQQYCWGKRIKCIQSDFSL